MRYQVGVGWVRVKRAGWGGAGLGRGRVVTERHTAPSVPKPKLDAQRAPITPHLDTCAQLAVEQGCGRTT